MTVIFFPLTLNILPCDSTYISPFATEQNSLKQHSHICCYILKMGSWKVYVPGTWNIRKWAIQEIIWLWVPALGLWMKKRQICIMIQLLVAFKSVTEASIKYLTNVFTHTDMKNFSNKIFNFKILELQIPLKNWNN
jgi:hypothetical protein